MNSFIGWIGGKRALRNEILQRMPADIGRYIEVFGGAGWVLFGREPSSKVMEVFNDYDAELVNIYRCIKYHPDALQHELDMLPDAREVFFDCLAQEQVRGLTDIQRAARSLYLIKASFGTDRHTFATAPKGVCNISASFPAVQERLRRVIIENLDFEHMPMVALHWEKYFQHICEKYNSIYKVQMPKITPHVCRHTFCSNMAKSGMNPKTLQYIMGHSDIGVTLNTYTHIGFEDAQEELQRVANAE